MVPIGQTSDHASGQTPGRRPMARPLAWGLVGLGLLLAFLMDHPVHDWIIAHRTPEVQDAMELVSAAGEGWRLFLIALGLFIIGLWHERVAFKVAGLGGMAAVFGGGIAVQLLKHLIGRCRPYLEDQGACLAAFAGPTVLRGHDSFPSGHATTAFALAGVLARTHPRARPLWYASAVAVSLSRLAINAHFLSDVLAGASLGLTVAFVVLRLGFSHKAPPAEPPAEEPATTSPPP